MPRGGQVRYSTAARKRAIKGRVKFFENFFRIISLRQTVYLTRKILNEGEINFNSMEAMFLSVVHKIRLMIRFSQAIRQYALMREGRL